MSVPRHIQEGVARLSISSEKPNSSKERDLNELLEERWVYGFHLKNRLINRFAEEYNLPLKTASFFTLTQITNHVIAVSGVYFRVASGLVRGVPATMFYFTEDDGRKRLKDLELSAEEMDKVREVMGHPKGKKPAWYVTSGRHNDDHELSSEDEEWGGEEDSVDEPDANERVFECIFIDLDEEDWDSDEDEVDDSDDSTKAEVTE